MKKVKHRLVEKMNEATADSLGLSRAVLVNGEGDSMRLESIHEPPPLPSILPVDKLVKKVDNLEKNARVYRGMTLLSDSINNSEAMVLCRYRSES